MANGTNQVRKVDPVVLDAMLHVFQINHDALDESVRLLETYLGTDMEDLGISMGVLYDCDAEYILEELMELRKRQRAEKRKRK